MMATLRRVARWALLPGLALVGLALWPSSVAADPAAGPFAEITGTVASGYTQSFSTSGPLAAAHSNVLVRFAVSGTGASDVGLVDEAGTTLDNGGVAWSGWSGFDLGDTPSVSIENDGNAAANFELDFYDVPDAPTSFTGATFLDSSGFFPLDGGSTLDYTAPGAAPYVANVTITSGAISIGSQTISSSGQVSLGNLSAGPHSLSIDQVSGPLAQWTIAIAPVSVVVSGVKFSAQFAPAGASQTLDYTLDGDATITATITNAAGTVVRTLATNFAVPYQANASNSLTWDGRDAGGNPVPDGTYTATIASTDAVGKPSSATATIVIDSTPPVASLASTTVEPRQAAVVNIADATSGLASATATFDNRHKVTLQGNQPQVAYAPSAGWTGGKHTVAVVAADRAGNILRKTLTFTVPSTPLTLAAFAGTWIGHTRVLTITRSGVAKESIGDGCCDSIIDLVLRLSHPRGTARDATVAARVTAVQVHDARAFSKAHPAPQLGEVGSLRLRDGVITELLTNATYCDAKAGDTGACGA